MSNLGKTVQSDSLILQMKSIKISYRLGDRRENMMIGDHRNRWLGGGDIESLPYYRAVTSGQWDPFQ